MGASTANRRLSTRRVAVSTYRVWYRPSRILCLSAIAAELNNHPPAIGAVRSSSPSSLCRFNLSSRMTAHRYSQQAKNHHLTLEDKNIHHFRRYFLHTLLLTCSMKFFRSFESNLVALLFVRAAKSSPLLPL